MYLNIEVSEFNLALLQAEVSKLKSLPPESHCSIALDVLQRAADTMAVDLADQAMQLVQYRTASHGWLRVPKEEIQRLKLEGRISRFSYLSDTHYYLKADSDMSRFLRAREKENRPVAGWEDEQIRSFPHISGIQRIDRLPGYVSVA